MTKIQIASDLHREFLKRIPEYYSTYPLELTDAKILILSGDIDTGNNAVDFLKIMLNHYEHVLYLPGNHEYYHNDVAHIDYFFETFEKMHCEKGKFYYMQKKEVVIDDIRFLGATLWTDFDKESPSVMWEARQSMNDYRCIHERDQEFTPDRSLMIHKDHRAWLLERLSTPVGRKNFVMTHHGPSSQSIAPEYVDNSLNGAYVSELPELLELADYWVHGHVHANFDYMAFNCNVIVNPHGYYMFYKNPNFIKDLTVDV